MHYLLKVRKYKGIKSRVKTRIKAVNGFTLRPKKFVGKDDDVPKPQG
jgi:hypothetical protein